MVNSEALKGNDKSDSLPVKNLLVNAKFIGQTIKSILENGEITKETVLEFLFGLMDQSIRVNGRMINVMAQECIYFLVETNFQVNQKIMQKMVLAICSSLILNSL